MNLKEDPGFWYEGGVAYSTIEENNESRLDCRRN